MGAGKGKGRRASVKGAKKQATTGGGGIGGTGATSSTEGELGRVIAEKTAEIKTWPAAQQPYTPPTSAYDLKPWHSFVKDSGITNAKLFSYYQGDDAPTAAPTDNDYEEVVYELLKDAVDVGAL